MQIHPANPGAGAEGELRFRALWAWVRPSRQLAEPPTDPGSPRVSFPVEIRLRQQFCAQEILPGGAAADHHPLPAQETGSHLQVGESQPALALQGLLSGIKPLTHVYLLPRQELPRFQELIFEDFARFILVENTYEEVVLQTVMKDILQGKRAGAAQRRLSWH